MLRTCWDGARPAGAGQVCSSNVSQGSPKVLGRQAQATQLYRRLMCQGANFRQGVGEARSEIFPIWPLPLGFCPRLEHPTPKVGRSRKAGKGGGCALAASVSLWLTRFLWVCFPFTFLAKERKRERGRKVWARAKTDMAGTVTGKQISTKTFHSQVNTQTAHVSTRTTMIQLTASQHTQSPAGQSLQVT